MNPIFRQYSSLCAVTLLAFSATAADQMKKWVSTGLAGGGAMYAPAVSPVNPRLMMVNCDMSGAYLSHDAGRTWDMIDSRQLRSSTSCRPTFHPRDTNIIFAAQAGAGLKMTQDGEIHWKSIKTGAGDLCGEIVIDPGTPANMMIGNHQGAYLSHDAGQTWTKCSGPHGSALGFHFDQTSATTGRVRFAATTDGLWRSEDDGQTWIEKSPSPGDKLLSFSAGSNRKAGVCVLYASIPSKVVDGRFTGGVFRSNDRGDTWESAMTGGINVETKAFDPWSHGPIAQYPWVLTCNSDPNSVWAFNSNTGVPPPHHSAAYHSTDGGRTWKATYFPDPRFPGYNCGPEFMTSVDGQYYQSPPLGVAIDADDGDRVIQTDGSYCFTTADAGQHWQNCTSYPDGDASAAGGGRRWHSNGLVVTSAWNYYIDPFNPDRHFIAYTDIGFARSLDHGATWNWWPRKGRAPWANTTYELVFDPEIPDKIWGAFSDSHDIPNYNAIGGGHRTDRPGGVCLSTNGGASWRPSSQGLPVHGVTSMAIDPKSPKDHRTLYASVFGDGVFKSTNDGDTWVNASSGLADPANRRACRLQFHPDGTLFVVVTGSKSKGRWAPGAGIYRSKDGAATWQKVNLSQEFAWPKDISVDQSDSRILYVGSCDANGQDQAGLWRTKDGGTTWTRLLHKGSEHFGAYLNPKHPGWIYATLTEGPPDAGLWLSQDDGATWKALNLPFSNAQRVAFDPADDSIIYVSTFGGGVWKGPAVE